MAEKPQPFHLLAVGKPYSAERWAWPEGADYNFREGGHELRIFLRHATAKEVAAIDSGPVEFGLLAEPSGLGLFLVTRFGRTTSFDCSYSWHRMARVTGEKTMPPPSEETSPELRALVAIILVEATTGVVLALRAVTFSPEFTRAIHRAIAQQAAGTFPPGRHEAWVDAMTQDSTGELWAKCTIRCRGGN
jgi:hypothetical protein